MSALYGRRFFMYILVSFLVLLHVGCFEYDEQIFMNKDGSGTLEIHYQAERDMKFQSLYFPTDLYDIEENIKENYQANGITDNSYNVLQKKDMTHVYMNFIFTQLSALNNAKRFRNEEFHRGENGSMVVLQRFLYLNESDIDYSRQVLESGMKTLFNKEPFKEIRFRFQWVVPGKIIDSNATLLGDSNRAIWIMNLEEILANRSTQFHLTYQRR